MRWPGIRAPRFRTLRTRLAVAYGALFAVALVAVAGVTQIIIRETARASVMAALSTNRSVFDRLWSLRQQSLVRSAEVLARDFGFRSAVATDDADTILSALDNVRRRAGVPHAMVVDLEGTVIGGGRLEAAVAALPFTMDEGANEAVVTVDGAVYRVILSPILAPAEIGWIVFAIPLDTAEMRALEKLSAIPLTATILRHDEKGQWLAVDGSVPASASLDALIAGTHSEGPITTLDFPTGQAFVLAKPLADPHGKAGAALLIRYPLAQAMAPYRPLSLGIGLAGVLGLLLVVLGSRHLARSISRPLGVLDAAAQSLEEGSSARVPVESDDEIGRLAQSFNRMSAGILERERRITHLALRDSLTGLSNRAAFRQALDLAIARSEHAGGAVAVLCLDLDGFKAVNDTLGHPVGDSLLRAVADMLSHRAADGVVTRLGGDEFAIMLSDGFDPDRPRVLAQSILDAFDTAVAVEGHLIATDITLGIAISPTDARDADTLLKNADLALYRAKREGRGRFHFFEPGLDEAARLRRQLELDLRAALQSGEFLLHYQPIVDLAADRIVSAEALLRWEHPTRGLVSPLEFIPVAEDTGLIVALGEWVLHEACRAAAGWPADVRIAVNVSPLQFRNAGFQAIVLQALSRSGLAPDRLEIEITESVFLDGAGDVVGMLHRLRDMGVRIALDDFGTGYSSLSYLRSFPFDKLKIDRSFVTSVADNAQAGAIVQAILDLASALHMDSTAEGVEDSAQLDCLRRRGCGSIQGFLFSRPVPADQLMTLLQAGRIAAAA